MAGLMPDFLIGILCKILLPHESKLNKFPPVRIGSRSGSPAPEVKNSGAGFCLMRYEQLIVGIVTLLYFSVGVLYASRGNMPWALVWLSYAMANVGLILAAIK